MSGDVISLQAYREKRNRPDFDEQRHKHIRERIADLSIEIALLESERDRLETVLSSFALREMNPDDQA